MLYQPVWIDGRPYAARLPTGGSCNGEENEWDGMLNVLGEKNPLYHAKNILSWCQDIDKNDPACRVYRGQISPRHRNSTYAHRYEYAHIGYRPVLEPLDVQTLQPAPDALRNIPDGTVLTMGSFYINGVPQPIPTDPNWCGNIPQYRPGSTLTIGDTHTSTDHQLRFIKCGHLLWCDRNLLTCISWNTLFSFGLVDGRAVPVQTISQSHTLGKEHPSLEARFSAVSRPSLTYAANPACKNTCDNLTL